MYRPFGVPKCINSPRLPQPSCEPFHSPSISPSPPAPTGDGGCGGANDFLPVQAARFDNSGTWLALLKTSKAGGSVARNKRGTKRTAYRTELHVWQTHALGKSVGEECGYDEWTRRFTDVVEDVRVPVRPRSARDVETAATGASERRHSRASWEEVDFKVPQDLNGPGSARGSSNSSSSELLDCIDASRTSQADCVDTEAKGESAKNPVHDGADVLWHDDSTHLCASFYSQQIPSIGRRDPCAFDTGGSSGSTTPKGHKKRRKRRRRGGHALVFYRVVSRETLACTPPRSNNPSPGRDSCSSVEGGGGSSSDGGSSGSDDLEMSFLADRALRSPQWMRARSDLRRGHGDGDGRGGSSNRKNARTRRRQAKGGVKKSYHHNSDTLSLQSPHDDDGRRHFATAAAAATPPPSRRRCPCEGNSTALPRGEEARRAEFCARFPAIYHPYFRDHWREKGEHFDLATHGHNYQPFVHRNRLRGGSGLALEGDEVTICIDDVLDRATGRTSQSGTSFTTRRVVLQKYMGILLAVCEREEILPPEAKTSGLKSSSFGRRELFALSLSWNGVVLGCHPIKPALRNSLGRELPFYGKDAPNTDLDIELSSGAVSGPYHLLVLGLIVRSRPVLEHVSAALAAGNLVIDTGGGDEA